MTHALTPIRARARRRWSVAFIALAAIVAVVIGLPVAGAGRDITLALTHPGQGPGEGVGPVHDGLVMLRTVGYPLIIGLVATVLAWPAAWLLRGAGRRGLFVASLLVGPALLPSYLSFAAFRLATAPMTRLGDLLARSPVEVQTAVTRAMAVLGLSLWAMPIAACVLAAGLTRLPPGVLDQLRVDGAGVRARAWQIARMTWRTQAASVGLVALLTIGSAVPVHLAQIDTLAQRAWWRLQLAPGGEAWLASWPVVLLAILAGWLLTRLVRTPPPAAEPSHAPCGRWAWYAGAAVWALGSLVPLALWALSLRTTGAIGATWRELGPAAVNSAAIACAAGCVAALITLLVWYVEGRSPGTGVVRIAVMGSVITAIVPGVLIGEALVSVWAFPGLGSVGDWLDQFGGRVALAHLARFAVVPVMIGLVLARTEPCESRSQRRIEGATGLGGWWRAEACTRWGALVGAGLAVASLSLHEIEAGVIVTPPGSTSLPSKLLEWLHYNRDEQLSAAALGLMGSGLVLAVLTAWLISSGAGLRMARGRIVEPSMTGDERSY